MIIIHDMLTFSPMQTLFFVRLKAKNVLKGFYDRTIYLVLLTVSSNQSRKINTIFCMCSPIAKSSACFISKASASSKHSKDQLVKSQVKHNHF